MSKSNIIDTSIADGKIYGRQEPHIYAFKTSQIGNFLKVGDTNRIVGARIKEWKQKYDDLVHDVEWEWEAKVGRDEIRYFRDYSIHEFIENEKHKRRLKPDEVKNGVYYSNEFFKDATPNDVEEAIADIEENIGTFKYKLYREDSSKAPITQRRNFPLRDNQREAVERFVEARKQGRRNLLMYAVMRFGKSFTSMNCALAMNAKIVLIVSAKADVKEEWYSTIMGHVNFKDFEFLVSDNLITNGIISKELNKNKRVAIFLTLQDLQGNEIKTKHRELLNSKIDLLIVDETHYGARAEEYGKILRNSTALKNNQIKAEIERLKNSEGEEQEKDGEKKLEEFKKVLNIDTTIHLSGTPYKILMGSEFKKEDIISFCTYVDISNAKEKWDEDYRAKIEMKEENPLTKKPYQYWDNPYFGFPQMVRFAFNPNTKALQLIEKLKEQGKSAYLFELFQPKATSRRTNNEHKKFKHEAEVLEFLKVIDGSVKDENVLGFIDYDKLKNGKMCRHMVFVMPLCASCDAMETLIGRYKMSFKNLKDYEIVNISGLENHFTSPDKVKSYIKKCEKENRKTITLTVNRMLTGSTVDEWDTMVFLKETSSPQEYDQAVFRIQSPYVTNYKDQDGNIYRKDNKPQTLLVDFAPSRMFVLQEAKSKIYDYNKNVRGNDELELRIAKELKVSPIICVNKGKMEEVMETDIMNEVRQYNSNKTVMDEAMGVPIDMSLLQNEDILAIIKKLNPIGSTKGIITKANEGEGHEYDDPDVEDVEDDTDNDSKKKKDTPKDESPRKEETEDEKRAKQISTFYLQVLLFALLTDNRLKSLNEIVNVIDSNDDNRRIARNINITKTDVELLYNSISTQTLSDLDYRIHTMNDLLKDEEVDPIKRVENATKKFCRMSEAEIVTPSDKASEVVDILPDVCFLQNHKILDVASKQGEFACALYKRYKDLKYEKGKKNIYAIPTSKLAEEFTRKVFSLLGIPKENIFTTFDTFDLLDENKQEKIKEKLRDMNFDTIIGNPPYQQLDAGDAASDAGAPIYHKMVYISKEIASKYVSLIMPSKWMIGGRQELSSFLDYMKRDVSISYIKDFQNDRTIFPDAHNDGGICYILWDKNKRTPKLKYTYVDMDGSAHDRISILENRFTKYIIRDDRIISILDKLYVVEESNDCQKFSQIVSKTRPYGLRKDIFNHPEKYSELNISDKEYKGSGEIFGVKGKKGGAKRTSAFINISKIEDKYKSLNKYKIFFTTTYSSDAIQPPEFIKAAPKQLCTETFLNIGPFNTKQEMENCASYMNTNFFKFLLFHGHGTMQVNKEVFSLIPLQVFSNKWTDDQLYKKYNLTKEEISFIESTIKPKD